MQALSTDVTQNEAANEQAANELERVFNKAHFLTMRIHGQFNLGFIMASIGSDLFIIDQHAADEKYNFERLRDSTVLNKCVACSASRSSAACSPLPCGVARRNSMCTCGRRQPLLVPADLELSPVDEMTLREHRAIFEQNGFSFIDCPATETLKLSAVPFSKGVTFGVDDVHELVCAVDATFLLWQRLSQTWTPPAAR
jgi:DNA mismatch repair protein PMS2